MTTDPTPQDTPALMRQLNVLGLFALVLILLFAFYDQFMKNDLPCPLCLLQRIGFVACMIPVLLNITYGPRPWYYGLLLISAFFGAAVALRQLSLHVIPGTPAYGEALLGLHFYTWSFITFSTIILLVGCVLLVPNQYAQEAHFVAFRQQPIWCQIVIALALCLILANACSALIECGLSVCAEDPTTYKLLSHPR